MSHAAKSVLVFGVYLIIQGLLLIFIPNLFLDFVGLPQSEDVWIRVVGWAVIALGYYYVNSARVDLKPFFKWTVHVRSAQFLFFIFLVFLSLAEPKLILFSGVEFLAGVWTFLALR